MDKNLIYTIYRMVVAAIAVCVLFSCEKQNVIKEKKVLIFQNGKEYPDWVFGLINGDSCLIKARLVTQGNEFKRITIEANSLEVDALNNIHVDYKYVEVVVVDVLHCPPLFKVSNTLVSDSYKRKSFLKCIIRSNDFGLSQIDNKSEKYIYMLVSPVSWNSKILEIRSVVRASDIKDVNDFLKNFPQYKETDDGFYWVK